MKKERKWYYLHPYEKLFCPRWARSQGWPSLFQWQIIEKMKKTHKGLNNQNVSKICSPKIAMRTALHLKELFWRSAPSTLPPEWGSHSFHEVNQYLPNPYRCREWCRLSHTLCSVVLRSYDKKCSLKHEGVVACLSYELRKLLTSRSWSRLDILLGISWGQKYPKASDRPGHRPQNASTYIEHTSSIAKDCSSPPDDKMCQPVINCQSGNLLGSCRLRLK